MDFSKLNQNEKLLLYGAVAAIIGGIVGSISGVIWISVLAGLLVLAVLLLPQFSPQTSLPGSRGSLLLAIGGVGAVAAALALLTVLVDIGFWFEFAAVRTILFLIGVAGALLVGWIAWQEFQAEGGKFQLGTAPSAAGAPPPASTTPPPATADDSVARPAGSSVEPAPPAGEPRPVDTGRPADAPRTDETFGSSDREDRPNP
jgi:hypothetical protein